MSEFLRGYLSGLSYAASVANSVAMGLQNTPLGDDSSGRGMAAARVALKSIAEAIAEEARRAAKPTSGGEHGEERA